MAFWLKLVWFSYPCISPIINLFSLRRAFSNKKVILQLDYDPQNMLLLPFKQTYKKHFIQKWWAIAPLKNKFYVSIHKFLPLVTLREDSTILHNNNLTILVIVWEYDRNVCQNLIQIMIPYHTAVLFPSKYFLPPCIKSRQMPYHQQTGRFIFLFDTKLQIGQKLYRIWKALLFAKKKLHVIHFEMEMFSIQFL